MISAPSCSAPCKAFFLNSLPFSKRLQPTSAETRPQQQLLPGQQGCHGHGPHVPSFPLSLQVRHLPTLFRSTCYFQDSPYRTESSSFPSGQSLLTLLHKTCLKGGDGEQKEKKSSWVLIPSLLPFCCVTLGKPHTSLGLLFPQL